MVGKPDRARTPLLRLRRHKLSDISNNAGSCQGVFLYFLFSLSFFGHTTPFTPKTGLIGSVKLCFDDHGSFVVIFRSASVRPKHLCDPYFDHDYLFKLPPCRGSGMPHQVHGVLLHVMSDTELSRVRTEF
jgi:hypothetical protein